MHTFQDKYALELVHQNTKRRGVNFFFFWPLLDKTQQDFGQRDMQTRTWYSTEKLQVLGRVWLSCSDDSGRQDEASGNGYLYSWFGSKGCVWQEGAVET